VDLSAIEGDAMRIDNEACHLYPNPCGQSAGSTSCSDDPTAFAALLAEKTEEATLTAESTDIDQSEFNKIENNGTDADSAEVPKADFTRMTRQEIRDWVNDQIRSGQMSIQESAPFLAMTIKISEATGEPVDVATDTTRLDYLEMARRGIEGALWRHDQEGAERLEKALDFMQRNQGQPLRSAPEVGPVTLTRPS
jgi:hypothetical protein